MLSIRVIPRFIATLTLILAISGTVSASGTSPAPTLGHAQTEPDTVDDAEEDWDGDGLTNAVEESEGTDPNNIDTDGDGLPDGEEVQVGTNPVSPDSEGDGVSDAEELQAGTDPVAWDTDGDGLSDGQELAPRIGTDPTVRDTDGDGASDCIEHHSDSNPLSAASSPTLASSAPENTDLWICTKWPYHPQNLATPITGG
jgi:hypothetical protein